MKRGKWVVARVGKERGAGQARFWRGFKRGQGLEDVILVIEKQGRVS